MNGVIYTSLFSFEIGKSNSKTTIVTITGWYKALRWKPMVQDPYMCYRPKCSFWNSANQFKMCFWSACLLFKNSRNNWFSSFQIDILLNGHRIGHVLRRQVCSLKWYLLKLLYLHVCWWKPRPVHLFQMCIKWKLAHLL